MTSFARFTVWCDVLFSLHWSAQDLKGKSDSEALD